MKEILQEKSIEEIKMGKLRQRGYTFIEVIVVVGILGMILAAMYPGIMNTLETRGIENSARNILTTMQRAKFQAVRTKINHRVGFLDDGGVWYYFIEREDHEITEGNLHRVEYTVSEADMVKYWCLGTSRSYLGVSTILAF